MEPLLQTLLQPCQGHSRAWNPCSVLMRLDAEPLLQTLSQPCSGSLPGLEPAQRADEAGRGAAAAAQRLLQRGRQGHLAKALLRERGHLGSLVADQRAEDAQAPALQLALQRLRAGT